jgi:hypothetical protein
MLAEISDGSPAVGAVRSSRREVGGQSTSYTYGQVFYWGLAAGIALGIVITVAIMMILNPTVVGL